VIREKLKGKRTATSFDAQQIQNKWEKAIGVSLTQRRYRNDILICEITI
jgi:hypothetical protein